jgi:hypothetical protein
LLSLIWFMPFFSLRKNVSSGVQNYHSLHWFDCLTSCSLFWIPPVPHEEFSASKNCIPTHYRVSWCVIMSHETTSRSTLAKYPHIKCTETKRC